MREVQREEGGRERYRGVKAGVWEGGRKGVGHAKKVIVKVGEGSQYSCVCAFPSSVPT